MMKKKFLTSLIAVAMSIIAAFACLGTAACKVSVPETETTPLSAPVIALSGNVISWDAVEHATGYTVMEGASAVSENQTATSYTVTKTEAGTYTYTVIAVSTDKAYTSSPASNAVQYVVEDVSKLSEPAVALTNSTVYVVGDSTLDSTFKDVYYMPRVGYGGALKDYLSLGTNAKVENLAASGRSSYSYLSESKTNYDNIKNNIKSGDFLVIGFGHNDEKTEDARYANPNLAYTDKTTLIAGRPASFKYILYTYYIKVALDAGATPILCTPIVRLQSSNNYASQHVTTTSGAYIGGDYAQAIRDLGEELDVTVVDLTSITAADYTAKGYTEAANYHAWTKEAISSVDATHTNLYGARMNAYYIARELKLSDNPLGKAVKANPAAPDKEQSLKDSVALGETNGYVHKDYSAPTTTSKLWTSITMTGWKGTAFGYLGGNPTTDKFTVKQTGQTFTVGAEELNGKIAGAADGIAGVYMQLNKLQNFKIEVTVKIDKFKDDTSNKQQGFGLMLRDDMYIDANDTSISSNYISAGWYGNGSGGNAIYMRKDTKLSNAGNSGTIAVGDTHTLSIEKQNQRFIVKYDDYTEEALFTDLSLEAIDNNYIYICLYATRGVVATYSNIVYTDNGLGTIA